MRLLIAALLVLGTPLAGADTETGAGVGLNLGVMAPGTWDIYQFDAGGAITLTLTWPRSLFPFADYDLFLYGQGALDDSVLGDDERIAESWNNPFAHHSERIDYGLPSYGRYYVAVAAHQAQAETYTLSSSSGSLDHAATTIGVETFT